MAAAGQTLVVWQRRLSLSVRARSRGPPSYTALPQSYGWPLLPSVIASVVGPELVGLLHGLLVTEWRVIIPLAATLGMTVVLLLGTVVVIGLAELVTQRTAIGHV